MRSSSRKSPKAVAEAEKRIAGRLPCLIDRLIDLAIGVPVIKTSAELRSVIETLEAACHDPAEFEAALEKVSWLYSTPPDRQSIQYLVERVMGKQSTEKDGEAAPLAPIRIIEVTKSIE
jgi:hypothetical protein